MASEATLDKYRQKIGSMDTESLRDEILKLEDNLVKVAGELYRLDTSDGSLTTDKSFKSKISVRATNQTSWDQKLDIAISELKSRGETYTPSEEYGKMCDVAGDIFNAVRIVFAERGEDGRSYGYDCILEPVGFLANASRYGPFKIESIPIAGNARTLLINGLLNNYIYTWGGKYMKPSTGGRSHWLLDIYTRDGGCVSYKGNVFHPYNFQSVTTLINTVVRM